MADNGSVSTWPELDYESWKDSALTLQLWTQIVGKVRLSLTPWLNHSWQVPFYVTARGLGTSAIPIGPELAEFEFDFLHHRLAGWTSTGREAAIALRPRSVADFYADFREMLATLEVPVHIHEVPNELDDPIPFSRDEIHRDYDMQAVETFRRVLVQADRVFKQFRTAFLGKASPVHFFWGSFDLAVTRFSGRPAPPHPGGVPALPDSVAREAYSHEVSSAGFWPGNAAYPQAAFYSYAYPEPAGYREARVEGGSFDTALGEYLLPYETVRASGDPDAVLLAFLQSSYEAAADCGDWDRNSLECAIGRPGIPRPV
ncbi:MAG: hypothetical protein JWO25_2221 [Alphaproteobacteria bacterium]|nr:hypothetical protein [Alphaproteobacteria bacterium]